MLNPSEPKDIKSIEKSRKIVKEILDFGVSENEIVKLIQLLSYELENTELMRNINNQILEKKDENEKKPNLFT